MGWDSSGGKTSNVGAGRWAVGSISSSGIGIASISISMGISNVSKTSISVSSIEKSGISLSLGFTLGNMDNSGRVSNIATSTSISTSYGWDSSGGKTSNVGAGRWTVGSISSSGIGKASISISVRISNMSKTSISISSIKKCWISISLWLGDSHGSKTTNSQEFVHVCREHYPL